MAGNAITPAQIDQMAAQDANWLGQVLAQVERRIYQWQTNCGTAAQLTALNYTNAGDQTQILQLLANLQAINACMTGTQTAANTHDMRVDFAQLQGIS